MDGRSLLLWPRRSSAELLRGQDAYVAASLDDPCSNALLEALACGLPALYRRSGGHPELVGEAGVGFDGAEDAPAALDRLAADLESSRAAIVVPALDRRRRPLSRGARRVSAGRALRAPARVARASAARLRTRGWPAHSRLFVLGDALGWALDDEAAYVSAVARRAGYRLGQPTWARFARDQAVFHTSHFAGARPALDRVVAPARDRVLPRAPRHARLPRVRPRARGARAPAGPLRPRPGDAPRDGGHRRRRRRASPSTSTESRSGSSSTASRSAARGSVAPRGPRSGSRPRRSS